MAASLPHTSRSLITTVELSIACRGLRDMDILSKSDPICVLYKKEFGQPNWVEHGRTEIIWNDLNPKFVKKFVLDYHFEERQYLKFKLFDVDDKGQDLSKHDFLGEMECTLGKIICSIKLEEKLTDSKKPSKDCGKIIVICEQRNAASKESVTLGFSASDLENKSTLGKSNPYLEISKEHEDGSFIPVHRTQHVKGNLNPEWKPVTISAMELCNGQYDRAIQLSCYHWKNGGDPLIGEVQTTLRNITRGTGIHNEYKLINAKKKAKQPEKYKNSGVLTLNMYSISSQYHFVDYIQGGCQIKVSVAVDFTKSNGDPTSPTSLHHHVPSGTPSQYARALTAVVDILLDYDSDRKIPAFGFGAIPRGRSEPSDLFPLNGDASDPDCDGLEGVLSAYHTTLQTARLYGPTHFAPVITYTANEAASFTKGEEYHILLILTDGIIDDMPDTRQCIVRASKLPLSIIIVGIGNEDFEPMCVLDGDNERISYKKEVAVRDIVQFVSFRDFDPQGMCSEVKGKMLLAQEVLAEVPEQLEGYMSSKNIHPKRRHKTTSTLV